MCRQEELEPPDFLATSMRQQTRSVLSANSLSIKINMEIEKKKKLKKRKDVPIVEEEPAESSVPEIEAAPSGEEAKKSKKKARRAVEEEESEAVPADAAENQVEVPISREEEKRSKKKVRREADDDVTEAAPANPAEEQVATAAQAGVRGNSILSDERFADLPICDEIKTALQSLGFERMSHIQARAIPEALAGRDVVGAAKTGSGYVDDISDIYCKLLTWGFSFAAKRSPFLYLSSSS